MRISRWSLPALSAVVVGLAAWFAPSPAPAAPPAQLLIGPLSQTAPSLIGGTVARGGQLPNVGQLVMTVKGQGTGTCTGTLISSRWVLTAAHCVAIPNAKLTGVAFQLNGKTYQSRRWVIHPSYIPTNFVAGNDIALVQLTTNVTGIPYGKLPSTPPSAGDSLTVVGYGLSGTGWDGTTGRRGLIVEDPRSGFFIFLPRQSTSGTKRYGTVKIGFVTPTHIGWNFNSPQITSVAPGDSGGPTFNAAGEIVGVASYGYGIGDFAWLTDLYETRVDIFVNWITTTMATVR